MRGGEVPALEAMKDYPTIAKGTALRVLIRECVSPAKQALYLLQRDLKGFPRVVIIP